MEDPRHLSETHVQVENGDSEKVTDFPKVAWVEGAE